MAGQFEDVRTRVAGGAEEEPEGLEAQLLYANALVGLRDLEGGVREIEEAMQIDPANAATYTNLALLKLAQGAREAAEEAFKKAVELDPKSLKARLALAHFHLATGNAALAEESLNEALALAPQRPAGQPRAGRRFTSAPGATRWPRSRCRSSPRSRRRAAPSSRWPTITSRLKRRERRDGGAASRCSRIRRPTPTRRLRLAQLAYSLGQRRAGDQDARPGARALPEPRRRAAGEGALARRRRAGRRRRSKRATAAVNASPRDVGALYLRGTLQAMTGQRRGRGEVVQRRAAPEPARGRGAGAAGAAEPQGGDARARSGPGPGGRANAQATRRGPAGAGAGADRPARAAARRGRDRPRCWRPTPERAGVQAARGTLELLRGNPAAARRRSRRRSTPTRPRLPR